MPGHFDDLPAPAVARPIRVWRRCGTLGRSVLATETTSG
ncbi:hypothetical protein SXCC_00204 [Gluconacetobacter sp. SXCC-1]|nr:hypothetical protein SXCC_00204 [Gluconacetobacter sp. SXCC-1]